MIVVVVVCLEFLRIILKETQSHVVQGFGPEFNVRNKALNYKSTVIDHSPPFLL